MNAFIVAFNAIVPIFLMILLGYGAKRIKIVSETFVNQAMKFVFRVSLPTMIFTKVSAIDLSESIRPSDLYLMAFCGIGLMAAFGLATFVARHVIKRPYTPEGDYVWGAFVQGAFRSNYVIIGYPILLNLFQDDVVVMLALLTVVAIPCFNIFSIIALTPRGEADGKEQLGKLLRTMATNPLIIAIVLGFISAAVGLKFPLIIADTLDMTASMATPLALVSIGAFFHFDHFMSTLKTTALATVIKLILLPIVFSFLAYLLGFSGMAIIVITVLFGGPTAISSFAMSNEMGGDTDLAGNIIIMTSGLCLFSYMIIISFWMDFLNLV